MMRGVKECNLEGLRKRICTLFLQYIKTPFFNPEVTRVLKVFLLSIMILIFVYGRAHYMLSVYRQRSKNSLSTKELAVLRMGRQAQSNGRVEMGNIICFFLFINIRLAIGKTAGVGFQEELKCGNGRSLTDELRKVYCIYGR